MAPDLIPDTRWVQWSELVDNEVDDDALATLEKLSKTLPKLLKWHVPLVSLRRAKLSKQHRQQHRQGKELAPKQKRSKAQ